MSNGKWNHNPCNPYYYHPYEHYYHYYILLLITSVITATPVIHEHYSFPLITIVPHIIQFTSI